MREKLLTAKDLLTFKNELIDELKEILNSKKEPANKKWLKTSEVCQLLDISDGTLLKLRLNGSIKYSRLGKIYYYDAEDIMATFKKQN